MYSEGDDDETARSSHEIEEARYEEDVTMYVVVIHRKHGTTEEICPVTIPPPHSSHRQTMRNICTAH